MSVSGKGVGMDNNLTGKNHRQNLILYCLVIFFILGAIDVVLQDSLDSKNINQARVDVLHKTAAIRANIEKEIVNNLLVLQGVANYISVQPDMNATLFDAYASIAIRDGKLLRNIAAAPDLVMQYIYPLTGNEAVLGVDYRTLPDQWALVERVIQQGSMVVAGPVSLLQGGKGLIGRVPVFVGGGYGGGLPAERLWGLVSAVIDMDKLVRLVGLSADPSLRFALRGADGKGEDGAVFWGDGNIFDSSHAPVLLNITFPSGGWQIAAVPSEGWPQHNPLALHIHATMIFIFLFLVALGFRDIQNRNSVLHAKEALAEAQALSHIGSWDHDIQSGRVVWSDEAYAIFGLTKYKTVPSVDLFFSMLHPNDKDAVSTEYYDSVSENRHFAIGHRIVRPDGSIRYVYEQGRHYYDEKGIAVRSIGTIHDVTERESIARDLAVEQAKLKAMAEATYDALIMIDSDDTVLFWSPAAERTFGWTQQEAMGQRMHPLITPREYLEDIYKGLKRFAKTGEGPVVNTIAELPAVKKNGEQFPSERSVSAFRIEDSYYAVGIIRDITERKAIEEKLTLLANEDELTGVLNRRKLLDQMRSEISRANRYERAVSIIMLDVDKFKHVNDTYGHVAGDAVLVAIAQRVKQCLRADDSLGRVGGEEFVVVLPETTLDGGVQAAERIRQIIQASAVVLDNGTSLSVTASLGVTQLHPGETDYTDVLKRADEAMYRAKSLGRNRVEEG